MSMFRFFVHSDMRRAPFLVRVAANLAALGFIFIFLMMAAGVMLGIAEAVLAK